MVIIPLLAAIMFTAKFCMSALPNIEPVTLLIIVYTDFMKKKTLLIIYIYVLLEGIFYGFGIWWISYLYVWAILFGCAYALRMIPHFLAKTALGALFGIVFGALTSIPYLFVGGIENFVAVFINGIPFDLLHCGGNALMVGVFYKPLSLLFEKMSVYMKKS